MVAQLSKQQLRLVLDYVLEVWRGLGLTGFEIHCVVDGGEDLDFVAKVNTIYNRRVELAFSEEAFNLDPDEFRELVVHEGLHVALDRLTSPVEKMLEAAQQGAAIGLAVELEEQAVERLGVALAPKFPLPGAKLRAVLARSASRSKDKRTSSAKKARDSG